MMTLLIQIGQENASSLMPSKENEEPSHPESPDPFITMRVSTQEGQNAHLAPKEGSPPRPPKSPDHEEPHLHDHLEFSSCSVESLDEEDSQKGGHFPPCNAAQCEASQELSNNGSLASLEDTSGSQPVYTYKYNIVLETASNDVDLLGLSTSENVNSCHSLNGSPLIGPGVRISLDESTSEDFENHHPLDLMNPSPEPSTSLEEICPSLIPEALYVRPHPSEKAGVVKLNTERSNSSILSSESKKRARASFQRRTLSETHYSKAELDKLRERCKKTRHSFCTYEEVCDNNNIVIDDKSLIFSNTSLAEEREELCASEDMPDVVLACSNHQGYLKSQVHKNSQFSAEAQLSNGGVAKKVGLMIPEVLLNNAKKSMIEEYKKLKKKNSHLSHESSSLDQDKASVKFHKIKDIHRASEVQRRSPTSAEQPFEEVESEWLHRNDSPSTASSQSSTVALVSDANPVKGRSTAFELDGSSNRIISLENFFARDFMGKTSTTGVGIPERPSQISFDTSSPPGRLKSWKNLLAEKKNSKNSSVVLEKCDLTPKLEVAPPSSDPSNLSGPFSSPLESGEVLNECTCIAIDEPVEPLQIEVLHKSKEALLVHSSPPNCDQDLHSLASVSFPSPNDRSKDSSLINVDKGSPVNNGNPTKKGVSEQKHKIKEACHGIAVALRTLPVVDESPENSSSFQLEQGVISSHEPTSEHPPNKPAETNGPHAIINRAFRDKMSSSAADKESASSVSPASSSSDDSDYCQTDECGDDCDYCSSNAEDEEDDICELCRKNRFHDSDCKHTRVMTNGSLKPLKRRKILQQVSREGHNVSNFCPLALQIALRKRRINKQELCAIREHSNTSDEKQPSDEEFSHDDSMCDLSSSWRFGLCRESELSRESTMQSEKSASSVPPSSDSILLAKLKSNSLPTSSQRRAYNRSQESKRPGSVILKSASVPEDASDSVISLLSGIKLPPRPSKFTRFKSSHNAGESISSTPLRPAMGVQSLQQRPPSSRYSNSHLVPTGPKTVVPRSPTNPNPPFGYPSPPSPPVFCHGSSGHCESQSPAAAVVAEGGASSPRTNCRSGALVSRNFSISDDEGGQRISRRQVTITRLDSISYRETGDPRGSPASSNSPTVDPYWITWKLGVLLKTVEEVGSRLDEAEHALSSLGAFPQNDPQSADQYAQNITKFRERLPDLQRGVDDVNDQAARFSAHNIALTPANSAALNNVNNKWKNLETTCNDRWRKAAGTSREATPLTPAQLATSVSAPWERATATNKVPYYINHAQETTHWDHPDMMDLLDSMSEFNHIKFSAYRTASKLRVLQKKLSLDHAKLQIVTDVFDEHGLRGQNDRLIDVNDMVVVLSTLYGRITSDHSEINTATSADLCLNWLLNVYDSQRTGQMRVLSFRIGLICLCRGHLEEKYRYMFRLIADPNRLVDQRKLGLLLHDCVQVPRQLGEVAAFGGSNIEPSVRSCFTKAGKDREAIEAVHFLAWVQQEPQSLVWLAVLHRVAASESVLHQVKCNICKTYPIVGLRYRCLKCLSFDMCQRCFFDGRSGKSHKITHPMHEYCTATTAGDEMKDFTKALKNKFKSKRSLQKHTKKGYLPVQTVLEGDALESPSPSPSHVSSHEVMHSRLELYASRLAEVELRTNSNSTPDSEDEHGLIAQYCQSLTSSDAPFPVPKSPLQIMASADADQKDELEQMIRDLEEENRCLQAEYEHLKSQQPSGVVLDDSLQRSESEMLAEAKLLREHKGRLEARMTILEDHNRQLEAQLQRLRHLLQEQTGVGSPNKSGTLQTKSVTASQLAMDSPAKINGHSIHGDLEKAVGHLVASMSPETENGLHSDEEDYDNTRAPRQMAPPDQ